MAYPTYPDTFIKEITIGDKTIEFEIGKFSEQVSASVIARCGGTVVHTTVALGDKKRLPFFPLSVEFEEKLYASGTIKGSRWVKRNGRPTDDAVLRARLIDRSLRPMFADGVRHEVQVVNTVFSYDGKNEPDMLALFAAGLGLEISEIPFEGPLAGVRVGLSESGDFVFNMDTEAIAKNDLDLIVSGTEESVVMVEAGANEVDEETMIDALEAAHAEIKKMASFIADVAKEVGREKVDLLTEDERAEQAREAELAQKMVDDYDEQVRDVVQKKAHLEDESDAQAAAIETIISDWGLDAEELDEEKSRDAELIKSAFDMATKKMARKMILEEGVRPDGRATDEIRDIWTEVDIFPHVHGSAMFKRGATQAVTTATLGAPSLAQHTEDIYGEGMRHYMHHYNMPPYAWGGTGRFGYPKRREIGHGRLGERALLPVIPSQEEFPYAINMVSEILSSNGSTSQASICGSTMALMAAGVPIKRPVSGIAMGLMSDGEKFVVLSDIQGLEDHTGDMDFKVSGTSKGITAIQMDMKLKGLQREILEKALRQAKNGRQHILDEMLKTISEPRANVSEHAPKIEQITIPGDRIGELIGPGGKVIKKIIEETGAQIDVDENEDGSLGIVNIGSPDQDKIDAAKKTIQGMFRVIEVGEKFEGTVNRIENYGAFVEILPDRDGLVHISKMSTDYVEDPTNIVSIGDRIQVRVDEIKDGGKISLSMLTSDEEKITKSNRSDKDDFKGGRKGSDKGKKSDDSGDKPGNPIRPN